MIRSRLFVFIALFGALLILLTACGGAAPAAPGGGAPAASGGSGPATFADIPTYTGATELKEGESKLADTLAQNNQANANLNSQLGTNVTTEQKGFSLPADAEWDKVKAFYDEKLKGSGWGTDSTTDTIMNQANQANPVFKSALWKKGTQTVTVMMVTDPTDATVKELIISLTTA